MPAMLPGAADTVGAAGVDAAISREAAAIAPTRRVAGTCTASR